MKKARQREEIIPIELIKLESGALFTAAANGRFGEDFAISRQWNAHRQSLVGAGEIAHQS